MKFYAVVGTLFRSFVYIFLMLPLAIVVMTSFSDTSYVVFPPQGFTLKWFPEALGNANFFKSIKVSLLIGAVSTCISTVIGTMASLYFWKTSGRAKEWIETIFLSPVVVPTVVSAVAFLQFYSGIGSIDTLAALILSYSIIQVSYVIRTVSASLYGMDASIEEAALVLGATPLRTLFKVTLPIAKRGIIAGAVFAFVVAFDEAVIVMFLSDARTITYPLRLYSYISENYTPMISAFSTVFILISFLVIYFTEKFIGVGKMY